MQVVYFTIEQKKERKKEAIPIPYIPILLYV